MHQIRSKLTYANVVATLALFMALAGGTAFAASQLEKESVGTRQLRKEAVTPAKLSNASKATLTGPPGPQGPKGEKGDKGERGEAGKQGAPATALWADVSSSGSLVHSSGATGATKLTAFGAGVYEVTFERDVSACSYQASDYNYASGVLVEPRSGIADGVFVETTNQSSALTDSQFYLAVFC